MQELIKVRRTEPWRNELRKSLGNKDRMTLLSVEPKELHQEPSIASLYIEDKQVFTDDEALAEARRCIDCPNPGCVEACPAHIHIPSFIKNIERGDLQSAWTILRERSTLSAVCSRVCDHDSQCEGSCIYNLSLKKRAVRIGALERYVATYESTHRDEFRSPEVAKSNGKKVAIVGAGPAGLAAAHDLALWGYTVIVYDRINSPGGVMRMGIPRFRLPCDVIDDEIARLMSYGVHFEYGVEIGVDVSLSDLQDQGYEAILLATGATESNLMGIEGENLDGVFAWNDYLYRANMTAPEEAETVLAGLKARCVAIVGGGNTAMDAARTARRMGAERVLLIYRRSMEEMPACRDEVEHALAEGIEFMTLHNPIKYISDEEGAVVAVELAEMILTEPDDSGRRRPVPTGATKLEEVDQVVVCVGVSPSPKLPQSINGLDLKWGSVVVVNEEQETSLPMIYAAGDASRGGSTVVHSMRDGRQAALTIHNKLSSL